MYTVSKALKTEILAEGMIYYDPVRERLKDGAVKHLKSLYYGEALRAYLQHTKLLGMPKVVVFHSVQLVKENAGGIPN
jgi:hypothetical protein